MNESAQSQPQPFAPVSAALDEEVASDAWIPTVEDLAISEGSYRWTNRLFAMLERVLRVNLKLHQPQYMADGEIFLFNHFARFETFIPQYFIYKESGAYSRSIASSEFFSPDDPMSRYLLSVGAVPNSLPHLLPFLALEVLRGRKVIVFPEGGMVKDRRVVDEDGRYSVYSRTAQSRRKHHSGAAVLALSLDAYKQAVLQARERGETRRIMQMAEAAGLSADALVEACRRPTTIVPSNITFYPIRIGENLLSKGAELIDRGLSRRLSEELMIEGNILLKHTDMDIRLGRPVEVARYWRWWERPLVKRGAEDIRSMHDVFRISTRSGPLRERMMARSLRREVARVRDDYMHRMYTSVSVNLSHLASVLILSMVEMGFDEVDDAQLRRMLYRSVRAVQKIPQVNLHRSLIEPDAYADLPWRRVARFEQFMETSVRSGLIETVSHRHRFLPKLRQEHDFDSVRLENLVEVYANEVQPLPDVGKAVREVLRTEPTVGAMEVARLQAEDEKVSHERDRDRYQRPEHAEINAAQTVTEPAEPFLLEPPQPGPTGIVLVHGFLASPAEMRPLAERLHALGCTAYGVRLRGHGTSPFDLNDQGYEAWLESTLRGISIVGGLCERIVAVGFSTGATLALHAAALEPRSLAGVCSICAPVRFQNPHMKLIPLVHQANRLVRSLSSLDGVKSFTSNESENPHINYSHMPVRGLYELRRLVDATLERLPEVECPVRLIQASDDQVVVPDSAEQIKRALTGTQAELCMIDTDRHGIAYAGVGETWRHVEEFVQSVSG